MVHPTVFLSLFGKKFGVAKTLLAYTQEALGLNLVRLTGYRNVSRVFAVRSGKYRNSTCNRLRQILSKSFLIHYNLTYWQILKIIAKHNHLSLFRIQRVNQEFNERLSHKQNLHLWKKITSPQKVCSSAIRASAKIIIISDVGHYMFFILDHVIRRDVIYFYDESTYKSLLSVKCLLRTKLPDIQCLWSTYYSKELSS